MESFYQTLSRIKQIQGVFQSPQAKGEIAPQKTQIDSSPPNISALQNDPSDPTFMDFLNEADNKKYPFSDLISQASEKYGLPDSLIQSVIKVESGFNKNAVSHKGAMGLMQLMPKTAAQYQVEEPYSPEENIDAGSQHLKRLLDRFDGNLIQALAAYNAGSNSIKNDSIPAYRETQNYIKKVIKNYMKFNGVEL